MQNVPKICLHMIVKNESEIIVKLLKSVCSFIDYFVIVDTGSEDNTIQIISEFFDENEIPGKIWRTQFENFEKTRNYALQKCYKYKNEFDYILLLDADMELIIHDNVNIVELKKKLTHDAYYLIQENLSLAYKNFRLMKASVNYFYKGVTHEFITSTQKFSSDFLSKDEIKINDVGNGGCKKNKYERDIQLLENALKTDSKNDRYLFYLGNSYRDNNEYEKAIECYKKRIQLGGWEQEIWHCYYNIGTCYKKNNNMSEAINSWLDGFQHLPHRLEGIYEIIYYYRCKGKHLLAFHFYKMAQMHKDSIPNEDNELFLMKDVYRFKLDYEVSILGYYINIENSVMNRLCLELLNKNVPSYVENSTLSNLKFYALNLKKETSVGKLPLENLTQIGKNITKKHAFEYHPSTPSVCMHNNKLYVVVRFINYYIDQEGKYKSKNINGTYEPLSRVETRNICSVFHFDCNKLIKEDEFEIAYDNQFDCYYKGIEDMRLFSFKNELYFTGTTITKHPGLHTHIEYGKLDLENKRTYSCLLNIENKHPVEKNWVLFSNNDEIYIIYSWFPLTICKFDETLFDKKLCIRDVNIHKRVEVDNVFKLVRGSTNGVEIDDEIWFIVHIVSYEEKRHYYHMFVVLDKTDFSMKRYSCIFTFDKTRVEYTLGFVYKEDEKKCIIGYSTNDSNPNYYYVKKEDIEKMMYN